MVIIYVSFGYLAIPVTLVLVVGARLIIHRLIIQQVEDHHITFGLTQQLNQRSHFKQVQIKDKILNCDHSAPAPLVTIEGTSIDLFALKTVDASAERATTLQSFSIPKLAAHQIVSNLSAAAIRI